MAATNGIQWMQRLAAHYADVNRRYPGDRLLVVFDIDGTILDMRYMVVFLLLKYDRAHGTRHFYGLTVDDIAVHEEHIEPYLARRTDLDDDLRADVQRFYDANLWKTDALYAAHEPYEAVFDIIRWFQIQPNTFVALNTGRPETVRDETLRVLNELGREYRVQFDPALLRMNPGGWEDDLPDNKLHGINHFQELGYRVVAAIDNEPANLEAMARAEGAEDVLFLHADTLFASKKRRRAKMVSGKQYTIAGLVTEDRVPNRVQFVWHGVNDALNLRQFLASTVHWGECDVRFDPLDRLVCRHDDFRDREWTKDEPTLPLEELLAQFARHERGVKLDLKPDSGLGSADPAPLIDRVLAALDGAGFTPDRVWLSGTIHHLQRASFERLAEALPGAVVQTPVGFLSPLVLAAPDEARRVLGTLAAWGVNRFSVSWKSERKRSIARFLMDAGYSVNLYDLPDLEAFLRAAVLLPDSITSDFNFPEWHYFGRGAGANGAFYRYDLR